MVFRQVKNLLAGWWTGWTEPHPAISDPGQRSRAKLLSGLSLGLGLLVFVITLLDVFQKKYGNISPEKAIPFQYILVPGLLMMLLVYIVSRSRYVKVAALMFLLLATGLIFVDLVAVRESSLDMAYLIFGVLMSSLFFDWKMTLLVLLGLMLSLLSLPWLTGGELTNSIFNAETFLTVIGVMIITIASLREQDRKRLETQTRVLAEREAELMASEEKYRTLVSEINEGIFETDNLGNFFYANQSMADIFGFESPGMLIGHNFMEFIAPETYDRVFKDFSEFIDGRLNLQVYLLEIQHPDGKHLQAEGRPILISMDGHVVGMRGTLRDVTVQLQAEAALLQAQARLEQRVAERTADLEEANLQLEKSAHLKDEFLASMSHELRTPLTGILGLTDVLQLQTYGQLSEKQLAALEHIATSGRHLLELINDILDFSKIEARQVSLRLMPCQVEQICRAALKSVNQKVQHKNLEAGLSVSPPDLIIQADPQRLKQMIMNLLSNAVKFTPNGGKIGIEVVGHPADGEVLISIWDTGIGIRPEDMPRLFQTFVQLDASLARQYNGTGLGLALVRRLAEMHGGGVSVKSEFGGGSRFTITLPW